jgi:hypothetical protein
MDGIKVHDQGRRAPGAGAKSEDAVAATQRPCIPRRRPGRSSGQDDDGLAERSELSRQTSFLPELRRRRIADTRSQRDIPHARDLSCIACHSGGVSFVQHTAADDSHFSPSTATSGDRVASGGSFGAPAFSSQPAAHASILLDGSGGLLAEPGTIGSDGGRGFRAKRPRSSSEDGEQKGSGCIALGSRENWVEAHFLRFSQDKEVERTRSLGSSSPPDAPASSSGASEFSNNDDDAPLPRKSMQGWWLRSMKGKRSTHHVVEQYLGVDT